MAVAYGLFVMAGQAVLLRELLELFRGNEAAAGILLFAWLAGNGLGAAALRSFPRARGLAPARMLAAAALALLSAVLAARVLSGILRYQALPGLIAAFGGACLLTVPVSFLSGACFSGLAASGGRGVARTYFLESAGAFMGGLAYVFLAGRADSVEICFFLFLGTTLLAIGPEKLRPRDWPAGLVWLAVLGLWVPLRGSLIDKGRALGFPGSEIVLAAASRYGNLVVSKDAGMESAYYGGRILYVADDILFEEEAALPILAARSSGRILIVGFPPPPLIREILAASSGRLTAVFPDPALDRLLDRWTAKADRERIEAIAADPYRWSARSSDRFDLIVVRQGLPVSVAENRLFSEYFYRNLSRLAGERGVVAMALDYQENAPGPCALRRLSAVKATLEACFPYVDFVPAGRFHFLASNSPVMTGETMILERLMKKGGAWRLVNAGYARHYFSAARRERFAGLLDECPASEVNRTFDMRLYREGLKEWLGRDLGEAAAAVGLLAAGLLYFGARARRDLAGRFSADARSLYIFTAGFAAMAVEIQFLYFFQSVSGALYYAYGVLAGAFMLGLAAGSGLALRGIARGDGFGISLLAWAAAVGTLFLLKQGSGFDSPAAYVTLLAINAWGGLGLGGLFAREAGAVSRGGETAEKASAKLYSFDLFGAAAAALLGPLFLIPFLGHRAAASVSFILLLAAMLVTRRFRHAA